MKNKVKHLNANQAERLNTFIWEEHLKDSPTPPPVEIPDTVIQEKLNIKRIKRILRRTAAFLEGRPLPEN